MQVLAASEPEALPSLPLYQPGSKADYKWSRGLGAGTDKKKAKMENMINKAYEQVITFRRNLFDRLPTGDATKKFIDAQAVLFRQAHDGSEKQLIALKAIAIMEPLLLQKPKRRTKIKMIKKALEARLKLWNEGQIDVLLENAIKIQLGLPPRRPHVHDPLKLSNTFAKLIFHGKVTQALRLLKLSEDGEVQLFTQDVKDRLHSLFPLPLPSPQQDRSCFMNGPMPSPPTEEEFLALDAETIVEAARKTKGGPGVSGADSSFWKHKLLNFGKSSHNLADAMASFARQLATRHLDPVGLEAFLANRIVALSKSDDRTRPIGIGEVFRRIICKAILSVIKPQIRTDIGLHNLCGGQPGGIEALVHRMRDQFETLGAEAILLVDAENAFQTLNRRATLHNARYLCPNFAVALSNIYRSPSRQFGVRGLNDFFEISSQEGTTQGSHLPCSCML